PKTTILFLIPKFFSGVNVEYELYNNYTVNGITKAAKAYELINGQAYIDFKTPASIKLKSFSVFFFGNLISA
ncbi:hypothetical protein Q604_UNBC17861G0001, partial [human gut metagenome]